MRERLAAAVGLTAHSAFRLALIVTAAALVLGASWSAEAKSSSGSGAVTVTVKRSATQRRVPAGFLGLSIEYWATESYAGKDPNAVNPVLIQLIRNLFAGHRGVLRIGGVTTDKTWWPVDHLKQPPGVSYKLTARRLAVIKALARAVEARLIMGINLEADSTTIASAEAQAILSDVGSKNILALEPGNEPELYANPNFGWYWQDGQPMPGRSPGYDLTAFTRDFSRITAALPPAPLAGPSTGAHKWFDQLNDFAAHQRRLHLMTIHRYAMQACFNPPTSPTYPTVARLLSATASRDPAASVAAPVRTARRHHLPLRIDEMNTISCGNPPGVPNTFAMALWALDTLFAEVQAGVDGVNIHTYPGAVYQLFRFSRTGSQWQALIEPEYYGLEMFTQAAPPGSSLLPTTGGIGTVRVWATRDSRGISRVLLINDDPRRSHAVAVRVAGTRRAATLERLLAPSAGATSGVTLGSQTYGSATTTGVLPGPPRMTTVPAASAGYRVRLPAGSAALLTIP